MKEKQRNIITWNTNHRLSTLMKFTFIISDFNKPNIVALPWKYVYELAKNLIQKGCIVQVITDGNRCNKIKLNGIDIFMVPKTRQPPRFANTINPHLANEAINDFSPELICLFGDYFVGYFARRLKTKVPMIAHVSKGVYSMRELRLSINDYLHISPYFYFLNSPMAKFMVRLLNQRKITAVTVPTLTIKKSLEKCGVRTKIRVLPMAFDKALCKLDNSNSDVSNVKEELGLSKGDFLLSYFGPPYARRGVIDLVRAIALLKHVVPVKLLLLLRQDSGVKSPYVNLIEKVTRKMRVTDRVMLNISILTRDRLVKYLKASDIIALPFRYVDEEPPLGLLEAMALGKPLITTNIDSLPEVVGNTRGVLVRPGNVNDLSKAIYYLFKHPDDAYSMAAENIKYVQTLKNWDELADCFSHLAEKLLYCA